MASPRSSVDERRQPAPSSVGNVVPATSYMTRSTISVPHATDLFDYPDSSRANRRPPFYSDAARTISLGHDTKLVDICGDLICTTSVVTRVWSLTTGKLILSMSHAEFVKITAVCFKPARKIEDDGMKIWLGTNVGEILEIDIASKKIVASETTAHSRREVIKLIRHGTEMWSLDDEGKLNVWPADGDGSPRISMYVPNGRVARRPSASIVVRNELWLAFGKEVKIVVPDGSQQISPQQASLQKFAFQAPNDVTSAAILQADPSRVYFGQSDGKISVFSTNDYSCLEIVTVSLYRINSLIGVGSYLWSGQGTGVMFVYDTRTKPWTIKKDWPAHDHPILSVASDYNNVWKLDKLSVVSLSTASLHIWDGLLEDDWFGMILMKARKDEADFLFTDEDMQNHISEFSRFNTMTSLVLTWNVGASKPTDLRYDEEDSNFFRKLLTSQEPPDILVFGLQELVDLEDKALTASR